MKTIIQIFGNWSANQVEILRQYGIVTEEGCNSIFIEEEKLSENVYSLLKEWRVMLAKGVEFSKKEILQSEYCIIDGCNSFGYPKPDGDFGYRELTYLMTNYCETCGISKTQKDAFRISKISKAKLWSLEWIYDEIFVEKSAYEAVFRPFGIACRCVKKYKKETIIDSVVQLVIPDTDQPVDLSEYEYEVCPVCGSRKYHPAVKGFFPLQENPTLHLYKSKEYFGSGASASKKVYVSAPLRDKMLEYKLAKSYWFVPCVRK